jgi:MbtH protein
MNQSQTVASVFQEECMFDDETRDFKVVVNHEEQYSIWPVERENPLGWRDAGKTGKKQECLEYIKEVWTDMRPLSLRRLMEAAAQKA